MDDPLERVPVEDAVERVCGIRLAEQVQDHRPPKALQYPAVEYSHPPHVPEVVSPRFTPTPLLELRLKERRHLARLEREPPQSREEADLNRARPL